MTDWYQETIEEPIRGVVRMLRNNGVNTECSCGHEMYVQCQFIPDGELYRICRLVYSWLHDRGEKVTFTMSLKLRVTDGHPFWTLDIRFPNGQLELKGDICVYKADPSRFDNLVYSAACGEGSPYYLTVKPSPKGQGTAQVCVNCNRAIDLQPGTYDVDKDWEQKP